MSSAVYPGNSLLPGVTYTVKRTPQFQSRIQTSISGKETRIADWSTARFTYELQYEFLRTDAIYLELQRLGAFYMARRGPLDSFLFDDTDDNTVVGQLIGTGDGATTAFQLVRSYGPGDTISTDPIYAPNVVSAVHLNGTLQDGGSYSVSNWGSAKPGVITFTSAPGSGVAITADFTFYWPVRFNDDTLEFEKFMKNLWSAKSVKFMSLK